MAGKRKYATPLLEELTKGPWPSFVREMERAAARSGMADGLLGQLEQSYRDRMGHWKHGGIVGVMGYGGGVIGRYSDCADRYPEVEQFHTIRVNQPAGWFYDSRSLRAICDLWDRNGSGLLNMHGSTGDLILLGARTEKLEPCFADLEKAGFDLGGSGSDLRTPSCCVGPARCEWACYDTLAACSHVTTKYQDELHRPAFPYKFKIKMSGCPNDCVASIARSDLALIGTWKDDIAIDPDAVRECAASGRVDVMRDVVMRCPARCMEWDGRDLAIDNSACTRCMHCINVMPRALRPGKDRGAIVLVGGKAPIMQGAQLASVLVPFLEMKEPYEDLYELVDAIWELWSEEGKNRERVGEFIRRVGLGRFCEAIGLPPSPYMVEHPRDNPYIFFDPAERGGAGGGA